MATLLDIGLLQHFQIIFPFLFITVMVFALLVMTKSFGDNRFVHLVLAIILGFMTLLSPIVRNTINIMAPWFVLLIIFIVLCLFAVQILGASTEGVWQGILLPQNQHIIVWVVALSLLIGFGSLAQAISEERGFKTLADGEEVVDRKETTGFFQVLFHPKILGLALILIISIITVTRLSSITS